MKFPKRFDKIILERGLDYFREGRVSNLLKNGDTFTASVDGSHKYKVKINLKNNHSSCNCPYEFGYCKHIAAVIFAIKNSKNIKSINDIDPKLLNMNKEELVKIIQKMLSEEPKLNKHLLNPEQQILEKIQNMDNLDEDEEWQEFYDYIPDRVNEILEDIQKQENKTEFLLKLLEKVHELNEKYRHHGSTEDSIIEVLEQLEEEKSKSTKTQAKKIDLEIKRILDKEHKTFIDCLVEDFQE